MVRRTRPFDRVGRSRSRDHRSSGDTCRITARLVHRPGAGLAATPRRPGASSRIHLGGDGQAPSGQLSAGRPRAEPRQDPYCWTTAGPRGTTSGPVPPRPRQDPYRRDHARTRTAETTAGPRGTTRDSCTASSYGKIKGRFFSPRWDAAPAWPDGPHNNAHVALSVS